MTSSGAAVADAADAGKAGEVLGVFQREGVGRAGVEPHVEHVVDLFVLGGVVVGREEPLRRALREPGVGAFLLEGVRRCAR